MADNAANYVGGALVVTGLSTPGTGIRTIPPGSASANNSPVAANIASVTILAANASRVSCIITNFSPGGSTLYLRLSTAGSAAVIATGNFTVILQPGQSFWTEPGEYFGPITGIWSAADAAGFAAVTEVV